MSIDPRYIASSVLQQELVDKDTGLPLSGGLVYFYEDNNRTVLKSVYTISGNPSNYTFIPLPNPIVLSAVGTIQDNNGNDVIPYYFPFVSLTDNTEDLYYVVVQNNLGVPQFTREAWPPNAQEGGASTSLENVQNFIPNGQFLTNNTIYPNNELSAGVNVIAPGGWQFVLPAETSSVNSLIFVPLESTTTGAPQNPAFEANIQCTTPISGDSVKSLRVYFYDVNKFSSPDQLYTFGFSGRSNAATINVDVKIVKYFGVGGSSFTPVTLETVTLTNSEGFFSLTPFVFGSNAGFTYGTGLTFVAIDIAFPVSLAFNVSLTDFVLIEGSFLLTDYPVQTNADTIARSIYGWTDLPNPDGFELYLPPLLTPYGMTWDTSSIGDIGQSVFTVISPNSASPIPNDNRMPCDGTSYITANFSANDIPFARLGDKLITNSPLANTPLFGTGLNFATAYAEAGETSSLRLTVNSNGTGSVGATDFDTGWTMGSIVTYGASSTGSNSIGYKAYSNISETLLAVSNFVTPNSAAVDGSGAQATGFTITTLNYYTGLLAQQFYAITVETVAASSLARPGNPAKYWLFSNASTDYYMWFQITNETDPSIGARTGIKVNLQGGETIQDVANIVREIMNAYQVSVIEVSSTPTPGQYFRFFTNPTAPMLFNVWYSVNGVGTAPEVTGTMIEVALIGTPTLAEIATATLKAINAYQYAAPDFRGMFLRGLDPNGTWDLDVTQRWSSISGLSGANIGTFEFQQLLGHIHIFAFGTDALSPGSGNSMLNTTYNITNTQSIQLTGGTETRPVNAAINYYIRY